MRKTLLVVLVTVALSLAVSKAAPCAELVGVVADAQGHPVASVEITVKDGAGKILGAARTDREGRYQLTGLASGTYTFAVDASGTGLKGGEAIAYLGPKGLTITWRLSDSAPAIAMATEGTEVAVAGDPFGYSPGAFAAMVAGAGGVVAGGVLGGYAGAGGFSGSGGGPPPAAASPAL